MTIFLNNVYENLDQRNKVIGIFLELIKAFDTENPTEVLRKLEKGNI